MSTLDKWTDEGPDVDAEPADLPDVPDAEIERLNFERERENGTVSWQDALGIKEPDIETERTGVYDVDGDERVVLVTDSETGAWFGWCACSEPKPCSHLCAVRQVAFLDESLVAEVDFV